MTRDRGIRRFQPGSQTGVRDGRLALDISPAQAQSACRLVRSAGSAPRAPCRSGEVAQRGTDTLNDHAHQAPAGPSHRPSPTTTPSLDRDMEDTSIDRRRFPASHRHTGPRLAGMTRPCPSRPSTAVQNPLQPVRWPGGSKRAALGVGPTGARRSRLSPMMAAAHLDRRERACRVAVEAASEPLREGLWLARAAPGP